uniref:Cyclin-dependent kinase inhibitor 1-like n=1 Tax=Astyanax mexicanus TaxID=7994 RepID=A0A3B1JKZ4_ASTMX
MAMMSSQCDHGELDRGEEDVKPRVAAVRRNLFGPVDHQQLQQDFQRLLCMSMEVAKQRWNFDFQSERPASGAVEWEEMRCQDVPAFYRSCVVRAGASKCRLESQTPVSSDRGALVASVAQEEYLELRASGAFRGAKLEKRRKLKPLGVKHRQATITDFFTVKKRRFLHQKVSSRQ